MKPRAYLAFAGLHGGDLKYYCASCKVGFSEQAERLIHPTHTGWLRKRPSVCPFAGKTFRVPTVELEENDGK